MVITAQELKVKGSKALKEGLEKDSVVFIQVRGKEEYMVLPKSEYEGFREYELQKALKEVRDDLKNGKFETQSAEEHIESLNL